MDRQAAIEILLEHYQSPHHRGPIADADVMMPGGNPGCGDVVTIFLKVDRSVDKVEKITFVGEGCTISQAAASILTDMVQDTPLVEIEDMDYHVMMDTLGQEVAQSRPRCSTLALGTLKAAIKKYRTDRMREEAGLPPTDDSVEPFLV
ncbi:MAG TPA: iron-sulfur cluster assembly scaffold protein [Chloroflexota bacterium]|nr:iron-sulfur cluster assembly scaffold protein [Chloroflexota bacterium]